LNAAIEVGAFRHPVADHPLGLGVEYFRSYLSRSRDE
jgi:hypothetical protein